MTNLSNLIAATAQLKCRQLALGLVHLHFLREVLLVKDETGDS